MSNNALGAILVGAVGGLLLYLNYKTAFSAQKVNTTSATSGTSGIPVQEVKSTVGYVLNGQPPPRKVESKKPVALADVSTWGVGGVLAPFGGSASTAQTYYEPPVIGPRPDVVPYTVGRFP